MASSKVIQNVEREVIIKGLKSDHSLNLGCGLDYIDGWVNLDGNKNIKADVYCNIDNNVLPFEDEEFDLIYASHILEHITNLIELKNELYRVLKPQGSLVVLVPHYLSLDAWGDDTHVRAFSEHSFMYMYWNGYNDIRLIKLPLKDSADNDTMWLIALLRKAEK